MFPQKRAKVAIQPEAIPEVVDRCSAS